MFATPLLHLPRQNWKLEFNLVFTSLQEAHLQQDMQYKCINAENRNSESQTFEIYKDYDECSEFDINESPEHS